MFDEFIVILQYVYIFTDFQLFIILFLSDNHLEQTCDLCLSLRQGNVPLYCECWLNTEYAMMTMRTGTYYNTSRASAVTNFSIALALFLWFCVFSLYSLSFSFISFSQNLCPALMMKVSSFLYDFPPLCRFYSNHTAETDTISKVYLLWFSWSHHINVYLNTFCPSWPHPLQHEQPRHIELIFCLSITSIHDKQHQNFCILCVEFNDSFSFSPQCR